MTEQSDNPTNLFTEANNFSFSAFEIVASGPDQVRQEYILKHFDKVPKAGDHITLVVTKFEDGNGQTKIVCQYKVIDQP